MRKLIITVMGGVFAASSLLTGLKVVEAATGAQFTAIPPFVNSGSPPLVMLAMGRDHKLYYDLEYLNITVFATHAMSDDMSFGHD